MPANESGPGSSSGEILEPMSQAYVRAVEAAYETLASRGLEAFADHSADEIEWQAMRGHWRGRQAGCAYLQEWLDLFDDFDTDVVELIDAPDGQVVTYLRYSGRATGSGLVVPPEYFAIVIEVRDGKITRAREYATRAEALEAGGAAGVGFKAGEYRRAHGRLDRPLRRSDESIFQAP
jgi:ketosteroid isomerase-like protein